jgi:hypothetical protein
MNGTYTFNKGDWSGEEATIVVNNNEFEFYGYNFKLIEDNWDFDGEDMTDYEVHGEGWDEALFKIRKDLDGGYYCMTCGLHRTHKNPFILAAIMAANTI